MNHYGPEENRHPGRPAAQPEEHQPGNPAQHAYGDHGAFRLGQILARVRHALCRGPAPLRRIAFGLRAAVPRSDGAAGGGFGRGAFAFDRHRAEDHHALAALDRGHDHRNLRLPARGLQRHRHAALPELRQADRAPIHRADRAGRCMALQTGRPHHGARARGARAQGRIQKGTREIREGGLRPRAHRWRAGQSRRAAAPRSAQESHHRNRGRPAAAESRHRAAARAIDRNGAEAPADWSPSPWWAARSTSIRKNWRAPIAAFPCRSSSRARSASIRPTARARSATAWARNTISIRRK